MQELVKATTSETEQLREIMVQRFENLAADVEKLRKGGRLSLQAIDRLITITRSIIELTG